VSQTLPSSRERLFIAVSALTALFLGALDTLVMSAAMPSVVSEMGALHLYSWVFSAYMFSRAVAMPVFGKLADIYGCRNLFVVAIVVFMTGSLLAGISQNMVQLVLTRTLQGVGAGGSFALVYVVLSEISAPADRSKMMSWGSVVWGLASVLGPPLGGFVVAYFSWRWLFYINLPLGIVSLAGILRYFRETRTKSAEAIIDYAGIVTMILSIIGLLLAFMLAGRTYAWRSRPVLGLLAVAILSGFLFLRVEQRARQPLLSIDFFAVRGFWTGNAAAFWCSFAIFSFSAFSPLFIQGAMGKTPASLGLAMLTLSLSWSLGAWVCGRTVERTGKRRISVFGALLLLGASGLALTFSAFTPLAAFAVALSLAGLGMGFVSLATLLTVQESLDVSALGVATATNQFARSLGGTIGVGISGSLVTARFSILLENAAVSGRYGPVDPRWIGELHHNLESLFRPEFQSQVPADILKQLQQAVGSGVSAVFWTCLLASLISVLLSTALPPKKI